MEWIVASIGIMVVSFIANVMLTEDCEHNWEERGDGMARCNKCKKKTSSRGFQRFNSN